MSWLIACRSAAASSERAGPGSADAAAGTRSAPSARAAAIRWLRMTGKVRDLQRLSTQKKSLNRRIKNAETRANTQGEVSSGLDDPWAGVPDTSGMTSRLLLAYAERRGGEALVAAVLEAAGVADHADTLLDERAWFPFAVKIRLFEALAEVLDDPLATRRAGEIALELNVANGLKVALRALGSPRLVYQSIVRANSKFTERHAMETLELQSDRARIAFRDLRGDAVHPLDCQYNIGLLSCVPAIFGRPVARINHPVCAAEGADACIYEIAWDGRPLMLRASIGAGALGA